MKLHFRDKKEEGKDIWSFFFEPPEPLNWQAGQSIRLELPKPTWGIDERRFSIASAPCEKHIQITTRLGKSSFKQSLSALKPGDPIEGQAIEGNFVLGLGNTPRLFLAGGIGITPYRALIAQAIHDKIPLNTTLLYSFSDEKPVFQTELETWGAQDPTLFIHYLPKAPINFDSHSTLTSFWQHNLVYISGPEEMVEELGKALLKQGLPKSQLKLDHFTGDLRI